MKAIYQGQVRSRPDVAIFLFCLDTGLLRPGCAKATKKISTLLITLCSAKRAECIAHLDAENQKIRDWSFFHFFKIRFKAWKKSSILYTIYTTMDVIFFTIFSNAQKTFNVFSIICCVIRFYWQATYLSYKH